ncbi:HeH/LEM domain-containing protein [Stenotrophomonas indicatrix]|uniref:HeH/LEM domain-containing protein n=1 Tax=Stenotrophomonas indicatrix TaxID=2045451 RepID=UPI0028AEBD31|nr:HeH/LEM domain-containing protein [Stenotrophomonas indicatrix]
MSKATVIVPVVLLTIQRSTEITITESVFKHEVPILELIHGEENVKVINDDYHAIELPNNATQEHQRLLTKYGDKYRPVIDQVFRGGARDIAKEVGMELGKDSFKKQSEAVINSQLPPRPGHNAEAGAGTGGDADLTAAELKAELAKRKVEFKGNASKADLQALLDDAKKAEAGAGTLGG